MAELAIKIGDAGPAADQYSDGDVLAAFNRRRIRCTHAQHICHVKEAQRNGDGLMLAGEVARDFCIHTHSHCITRLNRRQAELRRLSDDQTIIVTTDQDYTNFRGQDARQMQVAQFFDRRQRRAANHVFSVDNKPVIYYGLKDFSHAALDPVWTAIETKTPKREVDHRLWPCGTLDCRHHFFVSMDRDFGDDVAESLVSPLRDFTDPDDPIIVKRRQNRIDWRNDLGLSVRSIADVADRTITVDRRADFNYDRETVVRPRT